MRRIVFFIVAIFFFCLSSFAQNDNKIRQLRDNIAKNDVATQHPKKSTNVKTWLDRGKLFYDAYSVNVEYLRFNLPVSEARLFFREPRQIISGDDGSETFVYSNIKLIFENDALRNWEVTNSAADNPLAESFSAYQKARTLDPKGKNERRIDDAIRVIINDLETKFFNEFYLEKYLDAYNTAIQRIEFSQASGVTDTIYHFLAGFAAFTKSSNDDSMWQQAIDKFEAALNIGYRETGDRRGEIYNLLYTAYKSIGNDEKALYYAKTGFERHPEYTQLMYDLINYFLERNDNTLALEYLEQAVARDPNNAILLFAKGKVLDELGETEKSIGAYESSIKVDPTYFDPYYNLAVVHFNQGVRYDELANEQRIQAEYDRYKNLSDEAFYKAIAPMEKAYELRPSEISTVETLRTLYFRLRVKYPELEAKYDNMRRILEELQ